MSNANEDISEETLHTLADESLSAVSTVARRASQQLQSNPSDRSDVIVNQAIEDRANAESRIAAIGHAEQRAYSDLARRPLLSRIEVITDSGDRKIYFIARHAAPPNTGLTIASYNSPVGRLASIEPGETFTLPDGTAVELVNSAKLRTQYEDDLWDSVNTVFDHEHGPITIKSLRKILEQLTESPQPEEMRDFLSEILNSEDQQSNTVDGVQRQILEKIGIREQAILDKYQDEIFRLPIDSRLLVLGAPGTGKTTTLIRRLGQKTNAEYIREYLSDDEKDLIKAIAQTNTIPHADSWLMFSPTELLRLYLKEAFNRESVPASDDKIQTWDDYRLTLARSTLGLLKTGSSGSGLVVKKDANWLRADTARRPISWFRDFKKFSDETVIAEIQETASLLATHENDIALELSRSIEALFTDNPNQSVHARLLAIAAQREKVSAIRKEADVTIDAVAHSLLNKLIKNDGDYFENLSVYVEDLYNSGQTTDEATDEELDEELAEEVAEKQQSRRTFNRVKASLLYIARQKNKGKKINPESRQGKIADYLGEENWPDETSLSSLAHAADLRSLLAKLTSPIQRFFKRLPGRYQAFRKQRQKEEKWYLKSEIKNADVAPLELDVLVLYALTEARTFLLTRNIYDRISDASAILLQNIEALYRTQIIADEVTDFSPLQVACMGLLSHPQSGSFFACGDFNQRLTSWGSTTLKDIEWAISGIDVRRIEVVYRQSSELNALAKKIVALHDSDQTQMELPRGYADSATRPALTENNTDAELVDWLARQIAAVEETLDTLPSVAVFVPDCTMVEAMAEQLQTRLQDNNIPVIACVDGRSVGQDSQVRVFDIQHIKGLEFEAVFFPYIDKLAKKKKDLFSKYLYVGCTRAATFLGIGCEHTLPAQLEPLREHFVSSWDTA